MHQLLIHGFDLNGFTFADNDRDGKYRTELFCSYSEFGKAFSHPVYLDYEPDFNVGIFLFKPNQEAIYPTNMKKIKREMNEYIMSTGIMDNNFLTGIRVYDGLDRICQRDYQKR